MPDYVGTAVVVGQRLGRNSGVKFTYDPRRGLSYGTIIRGAVAEPTSTQFSINWWINFLIGNREAFDYEQQGPIGEIRITGQGGSDPGGNPEKPVDNWSLVGSEETKGWDQHPKSMAMEKDYPGSLAVIKGVADWYKSLNPFDVSGAAYSLSSLPPGFPVSWNFGSHASDASALFKMLVLGSDRYQVSQLCLKHSQTISDSYTHTDADWNFANLEKVYTVDQLVTEVGGGWPYNLPGTIQLAVNSMTAAPTGMDTDLYEWGWRKLTPTANSAAYCRTEVSTEYVLNGWSKVYYDPKT
jgi:hypothetical protein